MRKLLALAALALAGCAAPSAPVSRVRAPERTAAPAPVIAPTELALVRGPRGVVSIDADATPLKDVLVSLGRQTGKNLVAEPRCQQLPISLTLREVGLDVALDLLCERYGLEVQEVGRTPYAIQPARVTLQF